MDSEWESIMQFVAEPMDMDLPPPEKPVAEMAERTAIPMPPPQLPTPPTSTEGEPSNEPEEETLVSVSTTFYPGMQNGASAPDIVMLSSDSVFFYVHQRNLMKSSSNGFKGILPAAPPKDPAQQIPILNVMETSTVLNVVLHTMYDMSCTHYSPSFDALCSAVVALEEYGFDLKARVTQSTPLFTLLLSHAPLCPLELYALAAHYDLYDLAVLTSSHLLSFTLASLSDEIVQQMGPLYLKRLFFLHFGRADALKRLLLAPPHPHAPTQFCDFMEQKKLTRAWALASAYLAWDARPDLSTSTLESSLTPLGEHLECELCSNALKDRIKALIVQWSVVKRTI